MSNGLKKSEYAMTKHGIAKVMVEDTEGLYNSAFAVKNEIRPIDTKTAFLTELQALLRKYDAEICAIVGEDDATHGAKPMMWIQIGDDVVDYERGSDLCDIDADNIMDFEKEGV